MKNKFAFIIAPVVFCWCLFSLLGCKDPILENKQLLTSDDYLNGNKDTLHVKIFSEFEKPLVSSGISVGVLGNLNDPNFGNTYAGTYAQCRITSNNISFGDSLLGLDSVVLVLKYNGMYGNFTNPIGLLVFEVNQNMVDSISYHTNDAFQVNIPAIGKVDNYVPDLTDSVHLFNGDYPPHLRIRLSDAFGNKILHADTNTLRDNTAFLNLCKGLYVTTNPLSVGNGLVYLDLLSVISGVTLYYHNSISDSLSYNIPISGVAVNHFDNIYSNTSVYNSVNNPNLNGEEKMYLQAGVGVKGKIFIKDLDSLPKKIAVNKAELILTQSGTDTSYLAPSVLDLFRIDNAGQAQRLEDDGLISYGGVKVSETLSDGTTVNRYRFNIRKYFQKLVEGIYSNNGFYLQTISANSNSERVVITNTSTDKNYQVSLIITYTKL